MQDMKCSHQGIIDCTKMIDDGSTIIPSLTSKEGKRNPLALFSFQIKTVEKQINTNQRINHAPILH